MDTDSDTHEHVLRSFGNFAIDSEEVRTFESFESKVVLQKKQVYQLHSFSFLVRTLERG